MSLNPDSSEFVPSTMDSTDSPTSPTRSPYNHYTRLSFDAPEFTPDSVSQSLAEISISYDNDTTCSDPISVSSARQSSSSEVAIESLDANQDPLSCCFSSNAADKLQMEQTLYLDPFWRINLQRFNYWLNTTSSNDQSRRDDSAPLHLQNWSPITMREYHTLTPILDDSAAAEYTLLGRSGALSPGKNAPEFLLRARKSRGTSMFLLHVIPDVTLDDGAPLSSVDAYQRVQCPYILPLKEVFTNRQFGRFILVFVYEDIPGIISIQRALSCIPNHTHSSVLKSRAAQWSQQLLWAVYSVHRAGLALECPFTLDQTLLSLSLDRILINGFGLRPVLRAVKEHNGLVELDELPDLVQRQSKDYGQARWLMDEIKRAMRIERLDLENELPPTTAYSCEALGAALMKLGTPGFLINAAVHTCNAVERELAWQLKHDRHFRAIAKLGFINERPSHANDPQWSETGDRYVLKLFRDFLFHSQDEAGNPVVDMAHVMNALDKLDAASDEHIMLTSRDGSTCIFATYKQIKQKLDIVFAELCFPSITSSSSS